MENYPIIKAIKFAANKHRDQKYGEYPYLKHLMDVYAIVHLYYPDPFNAGNLHIAAILHDVLEDTDTTYDELVVEFGKYVSDIVFHVTNPSHDTSGKKLTRKEKHAIQYPIIACDMNAIIVKLGDRISNVMSGEKLSMYQKEHEFFKKSIGLERWTGKRGISHMTEYLDRLIAEDEHA